MGAEIKPLGLVKNTSNWETAICRQCRKPFRRDRRAAKDHCSYECRFWSKVDVRGPDDCWEWQGQKNRGGYGVNYRVGACRMAHRQAWEMFTRSKVPDGQFVLHRCDNRPCCNPAHHFLGTKTDNAIDMYRKGRDCHSKRRAGLQVRAHLLETSGVAGEGR